MTRNRTGLLGGLALVALVAPPAAADTAKDAEALAARIDKHLAAAQAKAKVKPAALADDSEFLRRVYLDIAGRIPTLTEARKFLDSKDADKRRELIDSLLDGAYYAPHYAAVYRALMLPEAAANIQARASAPQFE